MDSITQITLGAAVAEVVAGKKLGNRAILWGAVAGTIPDLDILSYLFMDDVDSLAFHRGISHSFAFAILGAFAIAYIVQKIYTSAYHKYLAALGWGGLFSAIYLGVNAGMFSGEVNPVVLSVSSFFLIGSLYYVYRRYFIKSIDVVNADYKLWVKLFFWSIITHPILDSFTTYGTQLLQPFSDYRAAIGNISVADPLYTVPFLACVIIMSFFARSSKKRRIINWTGIILSSIYMLFTIYNKQRINYVYEKSLINTGVKYNKYMTGPTILNNALWHGAATTDSTVVYGLYSLFDKKKEVEFNYLPKQDHLLDAKPDDRTINTLKWFSDGFYTILRRKDGKLQFNDMRYGAFTEEGEVEDQFIFKFILTKEADGYYSMEESRRRPDDNAGQLLEELWTRIKGI